jgi:hypothetical protein
MLVDNVDASGNQARIPLTLPLKHKRSKEMKLRIKGIEWARKKWYL